MSTMRILCFIAVLFLSVSACLAAPNVILIISDDHGFSDYGFMGHATVKTPHIDKLASQSVVFTRGYVPNSLCRASLATMITGLYPHQHGIAGNDPTLPAGTKGPASAVKTPEFVALRKVMVERFMKNPALPKLLAEKGYVSMQTGKWWEGAPASAGFTQGMTHGDPTKGGRHGDVGLKIGREGMKPALDFIDESVAAKKPFFLWYAPMLPHQPHNPPARLLEKYKDKTESLHVAKYWAMIEWFDETCGELLGHLDAKGVADDTLVIYLADNGWIQDPLKPAYDPRSKRSPYNGGLRTPLMVRWPARLKPRRDDATSVSSIDIAPTVLAACGLAKLKEMPGVDLAALATTEGAKAAAGRVIFGDIYQHDQPDLANPAKGLTHRWCIDGSMKLIVPANGGAVELYDLAKDADERTNLAATRKEDVERLSKKIEAWWASDAP